MDNNELKSLSWYKKEINDIYRKLHQAVQDEKNAVHIYNSIMISCAEAGYQASLNKKDKELKEKFKRLYDILQKEYYHVVDCVIKRKGYSDYLHQLKGQRSEVFDNESKS